MIQVNERYCSLLAEHGLTSVDAVMAQTGGRLVGGHPLRHVTRLELADQGGPVTVFLKRDWRRSPGDWARAIARCQWPHSRSVHEWRMLRVMRGAGFACPEPVAVGERRIGGLPGESFLMVRELDGVRPMTPFLHTMIAGPASTRQSFLTWFGSELGRLHAAGLWHTDLFSKHVLFGGEPDRWQWAMIDLQRAGHARTTPQWARRRDLATLDASTSPVVASRTDRLRFLHAYILAAGAPGNWKRWARRVLSASTVLQRQRKVREMRQCGASEQTAPEVVLLDGGHIRAQAAYRPALEHTGLVTLDALMTTRGTKFLRQLDERANVRIELPCGDGPVVTAFLKRHVTSDLCGWLRGGFSCRALLGPGSIEAHNVQRLRMAGVPTMQVIAHGQRVRRPWRVESFVLVEQIPNAMPLDDYLRERFGPPVPGPGDAQRRDLVTRLAHLVRRFHSAGFNHRDLYCCHVFVQDRAEQAPGLYLIDLQRVERRRWFRRRWLVKDLAQLSYSAPAERISRTDRMRFFRSYLGCGKLTAAHKRLARSVLAKMRRMARHVARQ